MKSKANIIDIIKDQMATLKNDDNNKWSFRCYFELLIIPLIIAGILTYIDLNLAKDTVNVLVTSLSVFAALLFSFLLLIYEYGRKIRVEPDKYTDDKVSSFEVKKRKANLIFETFNNISFSILISVFSIILLFILSILIDHDTNSTITIIFSFVSYYFVFIFIVSLLVVLRRVHKIFGDDLNPEKTPVELNIESDQIK